MLNFRNYIHRNFSPSTERLFNVVCTASLSNINGYYQGYIIDVKKAISRGFGDSYRIIKHHNGVGYTYTINHWYRTAFSHCSIISGKCINVMNARRENDALLLSGWFLSSSIRHLDFMILNGVLKRYQSSIYGRLIHGTLITTENDRYELTNYHYGQLHGLRFYRPANGFAELEFYHHGVRHGKRYRWYHLPKEISIFDTSTYHEDYHARKKYTTDDLHIEFIIDRYNYGEKTGLQYYWRKTGELIHRKKYASV